MRFLNRYPRVTLFIVSLLTAVSCCLPATLSAASPGVPRGRWEFQIVENVKTQYARGPIAYTLGFTLKEGGVGSTIIGIEYNGTPVTDGLFKGKSHVKALMACPITKASRDGDKLFLYSGGTFKLVSGDPPGYTIKDYATGGGLTPEVTIKTMFETFYGVAVFKIDGDDLVFVPKGKAGGKTVTFKKVR